MTGLDPKGLFFYLDKFYPLDMSYPNSAAKIALFFNPASQIAKTFAFALILPFLSLLFPGCGSDGGKEAPDVSHIAVDVQVKRFDQDIFAMDTAQLEAAMRQMANKYPDLFPLFTVNIIHDQTNPKELPDQALRAFLTTPQIRHLNDTVQQVYGNLKDLEKDLTQLFRYYKYYFPEKPIPQVVGMVSEFATDAFTAGDSLCGIGLDMFLGENYRGYDPELFPAYIRRQFRREYIPVRLAKALAQNVADQVPGDRLLDQMVYNGKVLYIVECLLPKTADSLVMGYTRAQLEGCFANEQAVWARLLDQNLLYSTDFAKFRKLVSPSPNAPLVFEEAPGEIGSWVGWQIVRSFMKRNPKTSMRELLGMTDTQAFLEKAKYKPRKE